MKRLIPGTFKEYKLYPKVAGAVAGILREGGVVVPVEVLIRMEKLTRKDYENWRFKRVPYLEKVIRCNPSKASRILRILRLHAHDLNLRPSSTAYMKWGKGPKPRLRFSKTGDPNIEATYARHFLTPSVANVKTARRPSRVLRAAKEDIRKGRFVETSDGFSRKDA